jgi:hypothetical protein
MPCAQLDTYTTLILNIHKYINGHVPHPVILNMQVSTYTLGIIKYARRIQTAQTEVIQIMFYVMLNAVYTTVVTVGLG